MVCERFVSINITVFTYMIKKGKLTIIIRREKKFSTTGQFHIKVQFQLVSSFFQETRHFRQIVELYTVKCSICGATLSTV